MKPGFILLLLFSANGCTLVKSTLVSRQDDNSFVGQSNGTPQDLGKTRPFRGIPVALKVPTHVDVAVTETYFIQEVGSGDKRTLREVVFDDPAVPRNLNVTITPVTTKKLFTVDFVRPMAGTLDYKAEFTDEQYFRSIENTITDETIQDVTAAIKTVAPALGFSASATIGEKLTDKMFTATRTVAYARFDIDAPDFEEQLNAFLTLQVTGCHNCAGRTAVEGGPPCSSPGCQQELIPTPAPAPSDPAASEQSSRANRLPNHAAKEGEPYYSSPDYIVYPYAEQPL